MTILKPRFPSLKEIRVGKSLLSLFVWSKVQCHFAGTAVRERSEKGGSVRIEFQHFHDKPDAEI